VELSLDRDKLCLTCVKILNTLKLSALVAQFFYQHRELNLPGIGTFYLDDSVTIPEITDKNFRDFLKHIQFRQKNILKPDDSLIEYIRAHTGKIKPLAESDLDSYVSDGKLLLNIGKPYHVEGIGTLQKNKEGIFEFTPGEPSLERFETIAHERETVKPARKKSAFEGNPEVAAGNRQRGLLIGALVIIGLGVIVWGGYSLYNRNAESPPPQQQANNPVSTADTTSHSQKDSVQPPPPVDSNKDKDRNKNTAVKVSAPKVSTPGMYRYVMETCHKTTALKRLNDLQDQLKNRLTVETKDSVLFRIIISLPGTPADTARIKDSLHNWYWGSRPKNIIIEQ